MISTPSRLFGKAVTYRLFVSWVRTRAPRTPYLFHFSQLHALLTDIVFQVLHVPSFCPCTSARELPYSCATLHVSACGPVNSEASKAFFKTTIFSCKLSSSWPSSAHERAAACFISSICKASQRCSTRCDTTYITTLAARSSWVIFRFGFGATPFFFSNTACETRNTNLPNASLSACEPPCSVAHEPITKLNFVQQVNSQLTGRAFQKTKGRVTLAPHSQSHTHTATQPHSHTAAQPHSHTATQPQPQPQPHTHNHNHNHNHNHTRPYSRPPARAVHVSISGSAASEPATRGTLHVPSAFR